MIRLLHKNFIGKAVTESVREAKYTIIATHDARDSFLPKQYQELVSQKIHEGLLCRRVLFSAQKTSLNAWKDLGKTKMLSTSRDFLRMIAVDNRQVFWSVPNDMLEIFFTSDEPRVVSQFRRYFENLWKAAR